MPLVRRINPLRLRTVPPWDLPTVLRALKGPPFEPLQSSSLRVLSLKTALLSALASVKQVGDLQALSVNSACLEFGPNDSKVVLKPRLESLLCPVRALKVYIERSASYRKSEQLFVGFGTILKVALLRSREFLSGCYHISILLLGVAVPHRSQSPFHQRHRFFLGMVQRGVHFRHLWGSRLVLTIHICKVLQPGCLCLAGQNPFCLSSNLPGSLDQHCSSPSFAWSVHN